MNLDFQRRVDRFLGSPLCRLLSILPSARDDAKDAPPPRRILVILLSEMGSLVLAQPMFLRIRERFPQASLHALVFRKNKEVLDLLEEVPEGNIFTLRNDSLSHLIADALAAVRALRRLPIDTVLDCELFSRVSAILSFLTGARRRVGFERHTQEGLYRGGFINRPVLYNPYQHIARQFLTLVEAIDGAGQPLAKRTTGGDRVEIRPLRLKGDEAAAMRRRVESDFSITRGARRVLIYPGGGLLPIRAWPLASFQRLARELTARGFVVGVIGLAEDRSLAAAICESSREQTVDFTGYTRTVRELMLLFHLSELLITNDGGPGHFAAMTPLRTIVLYGPETPDLYGTLDPDSFSFFSNLSCSPCLTAYNHRKSPCDGDNQCLKRIGPEEVLARALAMLASR
ncbi:MAG TPA: glycosyltransferase family 9 protein [Vicinamibacteria bacterium]